MSFKPWQIASACLAGAATLALFPAAAPAGTGLGATCDSPNHTGNATLLQLSVASGGPSYTVPPEGGVITLWETRETQATPMKLKLFTPGPGANQFTVAAESAQQTTASGINQFKDRIPAQGGEILGLSTGVSSPATPYCSASGATNAIKAGTPANYDPPVGGVLNVSAGAATGVLLDVGAIVEPDGDRDGYGDETQDLCPSEATAGAACKPVDRSGPTISGKSPKLSKLRNKKNNKIELTIGSNEAATLIASGEITVPGGASKTYKLAEVSAAVTAGGKATLKLKVPRKALKALRKKGRATSTINLVAKDAAGNQSTGKFSSKFKITKKKKTKRRNR